MKRLHKMICLILFACLFLVGQARAEVVIVFSHSEQTNTEKTSEPIYTAKANLEFHLRDAPESTRWVGTVRKHQKVDVLEFEDAWCLLSCNGNTGYAETNWLREFTTLDPFNHTLPGHRPCTGLWRFQKESVIKGGDFSGLTVSPGTVVAVREEQDGYILPVWRDETKLSASDGEYEPFTSWKEAEAGDMVAGFTTFYNDAYGAPKAKERQQNIELGCRLLDGTVLQSGDSFSFNKTCGPYGMKTGYVVARNISSSGYGVGGGVCQLSTTLYNAVLEVPLQITEWEVHSISGVKYIPLAYDSSVGTYCDLCFTNILPFAIRLEAMTQGGALTVLIYRAE